MKGLIALTALAMITSLGCAETPATPTTPANKGPKDPALAAQRVAELAELDPNVLAAPHREPKGPIDSSEEFDPALLGEAPLDEASDSGPQSGGGLNATHTPSAKARIASLTATVHGGTVSNANPAVARMGARFRNCYQNALDFTPQLKGKLVLRARLSPRGDVSNVDRTGGDLRSKPVVDCTIDVVRTGGFAPPEGPAEIVIEIEFEPEP